MSIETNTIHIELSEKPEILPTDIPDVFVRELNIDDADTLAELYENNKRSSNTGILTHSLLNTRDSEEYFRTEGTYFMGIWAAGKLVGNINIGVDSVNGERDIAYFLDTNHRKKGIAGAAVKAVVDWENTQGHDVTARIKRDNTQSAKLLARVGFIKSSYDRHENEEIHKKAAYSNVTDEQIEKTA